MNALPLSLACVGTTVTASFFYIAAYFCTCVAFFVFVQRPLFCLYNRASSSGRMTLSDLWNIYSKGIKTDLIVTSYLTVLPMLTIWVHSHLPIFDYSLPLLCIHILLSVVVALVTVADTALYKFWQFKIDASVFAYLRSLKGAFASVSTAYIVTALLATTAVGGLFFAAIRFVTHHLADCRPNDIPNLAGHVCIFTGFLLTTVCLFLIIRGLHRRPNNPSLTFYCKNPYYNHSALNPLYNLIYSFSVKNDFSKQFQSFDKAYCQKVFEPLFPVTGTPQLKLLNTTRPNILFIIWESLCSRYIASLGGIPDVTVNFDRLAKEGVLFTRCDAGSFRTDRGLVCLLSGYLGQPTTSVIRYTRKLPHLPALPRRLKEVGYATTAVHGGDLMIFHKSDYYWASGHDKLISQKDFPTSAPTGKWGIHDGYMFEWLYDDIQKKTADGIRWYTTFQTLSSHETWEVPYDRLATNKVANSFAYVDDCFGKFVDKLKQSPAWDNLLIVCTGDHGVNLDQALSRSENPHIPVLLLGGSVKQPMQIDTIISQTDLAATLLGQMELPHDEFVFSRDVLADSYRYPFSFHTYNNGFLFRDATGYTNFDNVANVALEGADPHREEMGKVILQTLYTDLSQR